MKGQFRSEFLLSVFSSFFIVCGFITAVRFGSIGFTAIRDGDVAKSFVCILFLLLFGIAFGFLSITKCVIMRKYLFTAVAVLVCFLLVSCGAMSDDISPELTEPIFDLATENGNDAKPETASHTFGDESSERTKEDLMTKTQFYIKANGKTFAADFADNSSAVAFCELLSNGDLTVIMHDYGNFEKVGEIGHALPQNNTQITTAPGDVILYLGSDITIYYDKNTWNFTRLGKIQNVTREDLLSVFGYSDVTVTFSLTK